MEVSKTKVPSFTLAELVVVMIITSIVVGMAFSVLRLVQNQIYSIQTNFEKTSNLALFEQQLWQDFNEKEVILYNENENKLQLQSEIDTVSYSFQDQFILRNTDTIHLKLQLVTLFFNGKKVTQDTIDAMAISGKAELPDYEIFVSRKNDLTLFMNQ